VLGNGDVQSADDAQGRVATYGVDGVLTGRATFGNPYVKELYGARHLCGRLVQTDSPHDVAELFRAHGVLGALPAEG
jgi:tRNA-dihydrouridine synthase